MRIIAALGGNALLERGEPPESDIQEGHVIKAVQALAPLAAERSPTATARRSGCWRWKAPRTGPSPGPTRSTCWARRPRE